MSQVTATHLKTELDEGEQFEVIEDGREAARIVPARPFDTDARYRSPGSSEARRSLSEEDRQRLLAPVKQTPEERAERLARLDALTEEIGRHMPKDGSTFDATDDLRRDL